MLNLNKIKKIPEIDKDKAELRKTVENFCHEYAKNVKSTGGCTFGLNFHNEHSDLEKKADRVQIQMDNGTLIYCLFKDERIVDKWGI